MGSKKVRYDVLSRRKPPHCTMESKQVGRSYIGTCTRFSRGQARSDRGQTPSSFALLPFSPQYREGAVGSMFSSLSLVVRTIEGCRLIDRCRCCNKPALPRSEVSCSLSDRYNTRADLQNLFQMLRVYVIGLVFLV